MTMVLPNINMIYILFRINYVYVTHILRFGRQVNSVPIKAIFNVVSVTLSVHICTFLYILHYSINGNKKGLQQQKRLLLL